MEMKIHRLANGSEVWDKNGRCKSVEAPFFIIGAADKASAVQEVLSIAEQELNGIPLKEFRVGEFDRDKNLEIFVIYESSSSGSESAGSESDSPRVSYSAGGGQVTVTSGDLVKTVSPSGKTAPDPGNFVNWNGKRGRDFAVNGVTVPTANPRLTYTKNINANTVNSATWQTKLEKLVGCVNSSRWKGRDAGSVMFVNFSFNGPVSGTEKVSVSFEFLIRPNEKNAQIGGLTVGDVYGWDYVWAITEPSPEGPPEVRGAYVSRVCRFADFSQIGV
jgi:hypothetical protein